MRGKKCLTSVKEIFRKNTSLDVLGEGGCGADSKLAGLG
jgi:hypothetical protein